MRKILMVAGLAVMSMAGAVLASEVVDQGVDVLVVEAEAVEMFEVDGVELKEIRRFENQLGALGKEGPKVLNRAVNRTGDMARTRVVKTLAVQTGLPQKLIRRSIKTRRSDWDNLRYTLVSTGGDVSLKYFKKRETRDGVVADLGAARGKELFIGDTFFRGGVFPGRRVDLGGSMAGHVFGRMGGRTDLERVNSGVFIPLEMVEGASAVAFEEVVQEVLPRRVEHEIGRVLG